MTTIPMVLDARDGRGYDIFSRLLRDRKSEWDYGQWDCMEQKLKRNHMETIEDCLLNP